MLRSFAALEKTSLASFDPPIDILRPANCSAPILITSPHSGRIYPKSFIKNSIQNLATLRKNEDAYVDILLERAAALGLPRLKARFPRCIVDVNRAADELPPMSNLKEQTNPPTQHVKTGLGVIPTHITPSEPIYRKMLTAEFAQTRLDRLYTPYHNALHALIDETRREFGRALLLDFHSMPGFNAFGQRHADIVLGNLHGRAANNSTIELLEKIFTGYGYKVVLNFPYAGGYVTKHYARPAAQIEVVQIEINRDLYVNMQTLRRKTSFYRHQKNLTKIIASMIEVYRQSASGTTLLAAQ